MRTILCIVVFATSTSVFAFWLQVSLMNRMAPGVVITGSDSPGAGTTPTCGYADSTTRDTQLCDKAEAEYAMAYSNTGVPCAGYDPTRPLPDACPPGTPVPGPKQPRGATTFARAEATAESIDQECMTDHQGQGNSSIFDECQRIAAQHLATFVALRAQARATPPPVADNCDRRRFPDEC